LKLLVQSVGKMSPLHSSKWLHTGLVRVGGQTMNASSKLDERRIRHVVALFALTFTLQYLFRLSQCAELHAEIRAQLWEKECARSENAGGGS
jgi:hypothetical protein